MRGGLVYARSAVPWAVLGSSTATVVGLLALVARWPHSMWPLHGGAIGLIAGASAWSADERCAAIVDVAPRPLWWRSAARSVAPVALSAVWIVVHLGASDRLPDHLGLLVAQGVAGSGLGFAAASALRARGRAEPGQWIASFACPFVLGLALAKPANRHLPLFPVWPHENWTRSTVMWVSASVVAVVVATSTLRRDARARPTAA